MGKATSYNHSMTMTRGVTLRKDGVLIPEQGHTIILDPNMVQIKYKDKQFPLSEVLEKLEALEANYIELVLLGKTNE